MVANWEIRLLNKAQSADKENLTSVRHAQFAGDQVYIAYMHGHLSHNIIPLAYLIHSWNIFRPMLLIMYIMPFYINLPI